MAQPASLLMPLKYQFQLAVVTPILFGALSMIFQCSLDPPKLTDPTFNINPVFYGGEGSLSALRDPDTYLLAAVPRREKGLMWTHIHLDNTIKLNTVTRTFTGPTHSLSLSPIHYMNCCPLLLATTDNHSTRNEAKTKSRGLCPSCMMMSFSCRHTSQALLSGLYRLHSFRNSHSTSLFTTWPQMIFF